MEKSKVNNENYFMIQGWMINELKLKGNELIIYAIIYGFSQDGQSKFTGSLQYLADWTNSTKQNCMNHLKSLIEKNLIEKEELEINNNKYCKYNAKLNTIQNFCIGIQNICTNNINNNIDNKNINNINIINSENLKNDKNNILEKPKKEMSDRQKLAIERTKILEEFIKDEDDDIKKALRDYVDIRKKRGLEPKQLQIILEDFEKAYSNKPKFIILEQIRKATARSWMALTYEDNFKGNTKVSYSSQPTFDNTANHNIKIHYISDEEFNKLTFDEKLLEMSKFGAVADMTPLQKEFFNQYCLARDNNGNLLKF